ncbi:MAG: ComEC/Rec2 family competence protein [Rhizobiaceae bacterium]|nr:ComEC/Rec2 family competence protein [Rhizobiaceae bacterium]
MGTGPPDIDVKERELVRAVAGVGANPALPARGLPDAGPTPIRVELVRRVASAGRALRQSATLELERGIPALLVPVSMGCGALAYYAASEEPPLFLLLLWVAAPFAGATAARGIPFLRLALLFISLVASGATLAKLEVYRAGTKVIGGEISTRLTGHVVNIDHLANGRVRLLIDVVRTERPTLRYQPDRVSVSASRLPDGTRAGDLITGPVRLMPPPGPVRPGGYDYSFQSYFRGIGANGFFLGMPKPAAPSASQPFEMRFKAMLDNARNAIAARIRQSIDGPEGEIAAALIVGVRAGIPESVNESLRRTGLAHILSISGLHMALVAAIVMGAVRSGAALVPRFATLYPAKKYAAAAALFVVGAYLFISGGDVAAERSFLMLAVMLLAVLVDRRALSMRNLAVAATVVMIFTPHEIAGPSFQMSFAATAALIGGYAIWGALRARRTPPTKSGAHVPLLRRMAQAVSSMVAGSIATALVAGLATAIFGVWHFQRISPLSLFANLATSPIVSLVVMPFAVLSATAMPFGIDAPFLIVMGKGLSAMLWISDWLSARSPLDVIGLVPGAAVIWLTAALLLATLATTRLRLLGLACGMAGVLCLQTGLTPDIYISDDAGVVAVGDGQGRLLLSDPNMRSFTLDGWKRAFMAQETIAPVRQKPDAGSKRADAIGFHPTQRTIEVLLTNISPHHFLCADSLCVLEHRSGSIIAVLAASRIPRELCAVADLIVVQVPKIHRPCRNGHTTTIDAASLARRGAAAVSIAQPAGAVWPDIAVEYAIGAHYRPWHAHRAFSRTARGQLPYMRSKAKAAVSSTRPG